MFWWCCWLCFFGCYPQLAIKSTKHKFDEQIPSYFTQPFKKTSCSHPGRPAWVVSAAAAKASEVNSEWVNFYRIRFLVGDGGGKVIELGACCTHFHRIQFPGGAAAAAKTVEVGTACPHFYRFRFPGGGGGDSPRWGCDAGQRRNL